MRYSFVLILICFFSFIGCSDNEGKKKNNYLEFHLMDRVDDMILEPYEIKTAKTIPYDRNSIYDPFVKKINPEAINKTSFEFKKGGLAHIKFLSKRESYIDVSSSNSYESKIRKAYPLIIENLSETDTLYLKLFRGNVLVFQEAEAKHNKWVTIDRLTSEKMGYYYYKVYPQEYIYTKIPVYKGDFKTNLRAKIYINDSTVFRTKEFEGSIPKRLLK